MSGEQIGWTVLVVLGVLLALAVLHDLILWATKWRG